MLACTISLAFGFRGGLFFASLFIGSLVGQVFAGATAHISMLGGVLDNSDAALVGMAAVAVAIVGGPMTMSVLVLEVTHEFALTSITLTAAICASTAQGVTLSPAQDVNSAIRTFDLGEAEYLAVVNDDGSVLGTVSERFVHRRYVDEVEKAQRRMFGE